MKIIIAGAGDVGFHLAKLLSYESQEITLIDLDKERLAYAETHLDIKVVSGDITSVSVLKASNIAITDLFISVTSFETSNITSCVLAKQLGAKRTIARISNTEFIENKAELGFEALGIDELISPESLVASEIELILNQSVFNDTYEFEAGALTMLGLTLSSEAQIIGKSVKVAAEILSDIHFIPIAIQRLGSRSTLIPRGDTNFKDGDRVVFMTSKGGDEELCKLTGKQKTPIKNIMILGGGQIGSNSASELANTDFNVKIVEKSKERAVVLADQLSDALVINGDGRNIELLEEENLSEMDALISLTGNSETNIMSCFVAKSKGVKKTIALVENMDYFALTQSIGVDTLTNKKLLAANSIFRYIRKGEVVAMAKLANMEAELLEFVV
ncbi:MAG: Trk system potassium transporter TrkA, partial [Bacteroidota bacterium]|nr:Trk system potassium transporter TrkA [Bacteroidota bacterium]